MVEGASSSGVKAGDTIEGRYRVIRALDEGGMGSVFLAEHILIKRRVAVKLMRAELAEDADVLERFMNEARAAGTLGHPNIVESTDMGFTRDGLPYIVFEYLEGSLLTDEIYRVHGFPVRRALRIGRQIASAVGAAHAAGIVHRDLKADNIFLTDREDALDHVKVLDFGISRFLEADGDPVRNREMVIGTPQFMAPEQIAAPEAVDQRADIYGLGVILYEMLTARRPFAHADPDELFKLIITQPPPPLDVLDIPGGFEDMLVTKFLAKKPGDRFQTMKEVESALALYADMVRTPSRDSIPILKLTALASSSPAIVQQFLSEAVTTVALPPLSPAKARRGPTPGWIVGSTVLFLAGLALFLVAPGGAGPDGGAPNLALLQADADKLAADIDAATHAAELRAGGFAQSPQLRAAVETDAATVKDLIGTDFVLAQAKGETFELFQLRDAAAVALFVAPEGPPLAVPTAAAPRLRSDGRVLSVVVSAPVVSPGGSGGVAGGVALAVPIDLGPAVKQLGTHATSVQVLGVTPPVQLLTLPGQASTPILVRVPVLRELGADLSLAVTTNSQGPGAAAPDSRVPLVQTACWVGGGLIAMLYLVSLIRARRRG